MLHADMHLLILFPIFCPTSPKKENNMWNLKMVLTEGFKDIWILEYILKVNFSSNCYNGEAFREYETQD